MDEKRYIEMMVKHLSRQTLDYVERYVRGLPDKHAEQIGKRLREVISSGGVR